MGAVQLVQAFGFGGGPFQHVRLRQLVHHQLATTAVAGAAQDVVGLLVDFPLRVVAVVGPLQHHFAGAHEARQVVDMAVGLVELAAARQPDHLLRAQVVGEAPGDLGLAQVLVAIAVEQALLGGENAALAIALDAAQLSDQWRAIAVEVFDLEDLGGDLVVLVPGVIQAAVEAAIGVELEVDAAHFAALVIDHEARPAVAEPGVVAGHFHHPHLRRQQPAGIGELGGGSTDGDRFALGNRGDDPHPDLLRRLGAVAPDVGALRPAKPATGLGFEFAGQAETIVFGSGVEQSGHGGKPRRCWGMATKLAPRRVKAPTMNIARQLNSTHQSLN